MNVENLAEQINHTLTKNGYFFLQDYVGESRLRFRAEKIRLFELIHQRSANQRGQRPSSFEWPSVEDESPHSPFEAVRSEETLGILRGQLIEERLRTVGAVAGLLLFAKGVVEPQARNSPPPAILRRLLRRLAVSINRTPSPTAFSDLLMIDEMISESGLLLPTNAFAIYRRRT